MSLVEVRDLRVRYDRRGSPNVLHDVDLDVDAGSFVSILGPSGSGKSTLLRVLGGLVPCTSGTVSLGGREIDGPSTERGLVFQSPTLLPWRTVLRNVSLGMEIQGSARPYWEGRAREMIRLVGLGGYEDSHPDVLSGGMQQRVNLARALALDPAVLLLDEPFSGLDALTRETMGDELLRVWGETAKTAVLVTHDIEESVFLSDTVHVLSRGPRSRISHTTPVPLPRPRDRSTRGSPEFSDIVGELRKVILGA